MLRSVLAVVVGFAAWSALWLGGDVAVRGAWPEAYPANFPETPMTATMPLAATLALSVLCSLAAGWLAAALGRRRAGAVWALALLLLAFGIAVQISTWSALPLWYHLPFLALLVPVCVFGGRLADRPHQAGG